MTAPRQVTLYSSSGCTLCRAVLADLELLAAEQDLLLREVDISAEPALAERYRHLVPVVDIAGGPLLTAPISIRQLRAALAGAAPG